jgi:hypothetical protein
MIIPAGCQQGAAGLQTDRRHHRRRILAVAGRHLHRRARPVSANLFGGQAAGTRGQQR